LFLEAHELMMATDKNAAAINFVLNLNILILVYNF